MDHVSGTTRSHNYRVENDVNTVRIISVRFLEDDVYDGGIPMASYDNAGVEDVECEDVAEAIALIQRHGLTFAATGNDWAGDPDGSQIIDYGTAEREEVSAHLQPGWTDQEVDAIIDAVG
jgi:hypothetical protein